MAWWQPSGGSSSSGWSASGSGSWWRESGSWWRDPAEPPSWSEGYGEFGPPQAQGAWRGGQRMGGAVWNWPGRGQERGRSGAPHEAVGPNVTHRLDVPISMKEAQTWWTETKQAAEEAGMKVSVRAKRYSGSGPGWVTFSALGTQGGTFIEESIRLLCWYMPDLDISAISVPEILGIFPQEAVRDALGNVKEWILKPPEELALVEAATLQSAPVRSDQAEAETLPARRRRREEGAAPQRRRRRLQPPPLPAKPAPPLARRAPLLPKWGPRPPPEGQSAGSSSAAGVTAVAAASVAEVVAVSLSGSGTAGVTAVTTSSVKKLPSVEVETDLPRAAPTPPPFLRRSQEAFAEVQQQQPVHFQVGLDRLSILGPISPPDPTVRIAFCSTVLRRPQVETALLINMALTWAYREQISWFVVDFNAPEERLVSRLGEKLLEAVDSGHLNFFVSDGMPYWHASVAKNSAHLLPPCETFDVLVNVDGDNILTVGFVEAAVTLAARMKSQELKMVHFSSSYEAGTYGRIAVATNTFLTLRGYDEEFLPSGCQDQDLILRALLLNDGAKVVAVTKPDLVGGSIANVVGGTWSECVQAKVANVAPGVRSKWGQMDATNRADMWRKLNAGEIQRNMGRLFLGVASLVFPSTRAPCAVGGGECQVAWLGRGFGMDLHSFWGLLNAVCGGWWVGIAMHGLEPEVRMCPVVFVADAEAGGPEGGGVAMTEPDAGVTAPLPKLTVQVSTFGCEKLDHACDGTNEGARKLREAWAPTRGKAPQAIPGELIMEALAGCDLPHVNVILDARCFYDWQPEVQQHIGHSATFLNSILQHKQFSMWWRKACSQIKCAINWKLSGSGGVTPLVLHVTVFCRAGEKRSVACAWLLEQGLRGLGCEVLPAVHLCAMFWKRKTCGGDRCNECDTTGALHGDIAAYAVKLMRAEFDRHD